MVMLTVVALISIAIFFQYGSGAIVGELLFFELGIGFLVLLGYRFIKSKTKKKESTPIV